VSALGTTVAPSSSTAPASTDGVTMRRVLASEWTKLWTLRSTRWTLLVAFVVMSALGPIASAVQMAHWAHMSPQDRATFDAINTATGGWHGAQLAIGVLGVLVISGEYTTGMIRSSLMAVPHRLPVLWAKILVYAGVTFVLMLVATLISFFASQPILTEHHVQHSLGDPGALRTVIGCALFMTVLGAMCVGFGALLRSTAGGLATFVGLLFVLPGLLDILGSSLNNTVSPYLPLNAGMTVLSHSFDSPHHLSVWGGFALFCGYAVAAIAAAAVTLMRRDA
jgi:ABC-type transport system involved in multi-copper enzyme maturation permease subunit